MSGFSVAMSISDRIETVSCEMTPDEAIALAAALERAAFIARRAASIGTQRAEAETGFRNMSPAQVDASGSAEFRRAFYAAKYAAKG